MAMLIDFFQVSILVSGKSDAMVVGTMTPNILNSSAQVYVIEKLDGTVLYYPCSEVMISVAPVYKGD